MIALIGGISFISSMVKSCQREVSNSLKDSSPVLSYLVSEEHTPWNDIKYITDYLSGSKDSKNSNKSDICLRFFIDGQKNAAQNHNDIAIKDYNYALKYAQNRDIKAFIYLHRAHSLHALGRYHEAINDFSQSLELVKQNKIARAYILSFRSISYFYIGNLDASKKDIDTALIFDNKCAIAYLAKGNLMLFYANKTKNLIYCTIAEKNFILAKQYGAKDIKILAEDALKHLHEQRAPD